MDTQVAQEKTTEVVSELDKLLKRTRSGLENLQPKI